MAGTDLGAVEPAVVGGPGAESNAAPELAHAILADAIDRQRRNVQVQGSGRVLRVLADDNDGSRHQRFILALASGRTLLIAHNIDLAPPCSRCTPAIRWHSMASTNGAARAA